MSAVRRLILALVWLASCRPLPVPTDFVYPDALAANDSTDATALPGCGTPACDGDDSLATCPSDCAAFAVRLAGPCTQTGSQDSCGRGWFCVARDASVGGPVCVADFATWAPLGDKRDDGDFAESGDAIADRATGLTWARLSLRKLSWPDAMTSCTQQTWNGFHDWRLPTRAELRSLVDYTEVNPSARLAHFDWLQGDLQYWTAVPAPAPVGVDAPYGLEVSFANAKAPADRFDTPLAVRCVRGGVQGQPMAASFEVRAGGLVVFDRLTGLTWQRAPAPNELPIVPAQQFCTKNQLQLPGPGWRLPSLRELEALLRIGPTLPNFDDAFATTSEQWSWTTTTVVGIVDRIWMHSWDLGPDWAQGNDTLQFRCVR